MSRTLSTLKIGLRERENKTMWTLIDWIDEHALLLLEDKLLHAVVYNSNYMLAVFAAISQVEA